VVPVAGNDITKALRAKFKLAAEQAEKLKRNAAKSKDAAAVFEAMKPPLKEMVGEIYRAVGFYKSQNEEANINQLVMMGNGSKLLNIKKFFEQQLQYQVHKVDAPQRLALARTVDPSEVQANVQSLTVAVGLALQGLGVDGLNRINLIPPEYITAKETEKLRMPFFVGGGIAAAGGLIALVMAILATGGLQTLLQAAEAAEKTATAQTSKHQTAINVGDEGQKAQSLENLTGGWMGTLPARTGKDAAGNDVEIPEKRLVARTGAMPGLLTDALHEAARRYDAAPANGALKPKMYYANLAGSGAPNLESMRAATTWMKQESLQPFYVRPAGQSEGGVFAPDRVITLHVYFALDLQSASPNDALQAMRQIFLPFESDQERGTLTSGLLREEIRNRLMKHFDETGQLEGVSAEARKTIIFDGVDVDVRIMTEGSQNSRYRLHDIVPTQGLWRIDGNPMQIPSKSMPTLEFAGADVSITVTLKGVAPIPEGE
jgi:hypothetical protein